MKRLHVHVAVEDLNHSIQFYSTLFGDKPSVVKSDYAKWMLEDPRVNFAISMRGQKPGLDHLGIQVENGEELQAIARNLQTAEQEVMEENAACCYAKSDKAWVRDPQGIAWETFITHGEATTYGKDDTNRDNLAQKIAATSWCVPKAGTKSGCS